MKILKINLLKPPVLTLWNMTRMFTNYAKFGAECIQCSKLPSHFCPMLQIGAISYVESSKFVQGLVGKMCKVQQHCPRSISTLYFIQQMKIKPPNCPKKFNHNCDKKNYEMFWSKEQYNAHRLQIAVWEDDLRSSGTGWAPLGRWIGRLLYWCTLPLFYRMQIYLGSDQWVRMYFTET